MGESGKCTTLNIIDTIIKLISSVFLAIIVIILNIASDKISNSIEQGNLIQNLINDLTTRDVQARQDIALIALNHSLGDTRPDLIIDIAERIFFDLLESDSINTSAHSASLGSVAFRIIEQRSPTKADSIRQVVLSNEKLASNVPSRRSAPDIQTLQPSVSMAIRQDNFYNIVTKSFKNLIYIQYMPANKKKSAEKIRELLNEKGYNAAPIEMVDGRYKTGIRYFHDSDIELANSIANSITSELSLDSIPTNKIDNTRYKVTPGHIEIWLNMKNIR